MRDLSQTHSTSPWLPREQLTKDLRTSETLISAASRLFAGMLGGARGWCCGVYFSCPVRGEMLNGALNRRHSKPEHGQPSSQRTFCFFFTLLLFFLSLFLRKVISRGAERKKETVWGKTLLCEKQFDGWWWEEEGGRAKLLWRPIPLLKAERYNCSQYWL